MKFPHPSILVRLWISCFLSASLCASFAQAPSYSWGNAAIGGGGYVTGIEYHPRQAGLVYARTDVGGAYRRDKPDGPWLALNDAIGGVDNQFMQLGVLSLALDPSDSNRVYLACGQYCAPWAPPAVLMASMDRGTTWKETPLPFKLGGNQNGRGTGERLAVDPFHGETLLLGTTQDGLWRSADRGATWVRVTGFSPASTTFVRFDPVHAGTIFAGAAQTTGPSLWKSQDGGGTWIAVPRQPEGLIALQTAFDSKGDLFVTFADAVGPNGATKGVLWKLSSDGSSETLPVPGGGGGYGGVATDRSLPGRIVVSTLDRWWPADEIYRSDDGGRTWTGILAGASLDHSSAPWGASLKPHWITDVEIDPSVPGKVSFVTGYGVYSTDKAGIDNDKPRWFFDNPGIEESVPLGLVSAAEGAPLVSVIADFDGFRHDRLDASPSLGRHAPHHGTTHSLDGAGAAPAVLARLHGDTGSVSRDGGRTWKDFPSAPPSAKGGRIAVSADGARLLLCPHEGIPLLSSDDGATWAAASGCPSGRFSPAADRVDRLRLFLFDTATHRIVRSEDGGVTFAAAGELPEGGQRIKPAPGYSGHLWHAAGKAGLWRSGDSGATFHQAVAVERAYEIGFGKPAPGKTYPAVYLWGRVKGVDGIFRSDDAGETWHRINDDHHQFGAINDLTGDPRAFGRVYLATSGRGVIVGEPSAKDPGPTGIGR